MMTRIPAEFSISELATILGLPRHVVRYRVRRGAIPSARSNPSVGERSKRVIPLALLKESCPHYFDAIVVRAQLSVQDEDEDY